MFCFSATNQTLLWVSGVELEDDIYPPTVSADGSFSAMVEWNSPGRFYVFDRDNPFKPFISYASTDQYGGWGGASISSDGTSIALGTSKGLYCYTNENGNVTLNWNYGNLPVTSTAVSSTGRYIAYVCFDSKDGFLYFFDSSTLQKNPQSGLWPWLIVVAVVIVGLVVGGIFLFKRRKPVSPQSGAGLPAEKPQGPSSAFCLRAL